LCACATVELTNRFAAWYDDHSPMQALACTPVQEDQDLPALRQLIAKAAGAGKSDTAAFLRQYEEIRLASRHAAHILYGKKGDPFGLIVTEALIHPAREIFAWLDLPEHLLQPLPDSSFPEKALLLRKAVSRFLYHGAKSIAICLGRDDSALQLEKGVRDAIHEAYPSHYLGSIPVILAPRRANWERNERLEAAMVSGYVRTGLARHIQNVMQFVRWMGFRGRFSAKNAGEEYVPIAQCDPWSFVSEPGRRFREAVLKWAEEHETAPGLAVGLSAETFEIAIIGNRQIRFLPGLFSRWTRSGSPFLPGVNEKLYSEGDEEENWLNEDDRRIVQRMDRLIPEIRKAAESAGLQLLASTPLFISGDDGGLAGWAIAEKLGLGAFCLYPGRKLNFPRAPDLDDGAERDGPLLFKGYEAPCRVPPGWKIRRLGGTSFLQMRRVR